MPAGTNRCVLLDRVDGNAVDHASLHLESKDVDFAETLRSADLEEVGDDGTYSLQYEARKRIDD